MRRCREELKMIKEIKFNENDDYANLKEKINKIKIFLNNVSNQMN